ncbi:MAG: PPE family protein [Mycobacterium sp.]|uniref:PPE family protein n=1 Tax=Mycobacterium sp. TaxID=1785 RepID=UPI002635523F|nr:PPE family protein [Mycobacterium sp.]MDI3314343.1 PPE family protein [Mycobacterium sp.]
MDFGKLPPEINSGRMYAGPGALSMLVASVAWGRLATELHTAAAGYQWVTTSLAGGGWDGASADLMAAAAAPYVAWLSDTAAKAEQAAAQARAAAGAFDIAHRMTVPPPLIAANRAQLRRLAATNFLAQYSPAIAAIEADYEEMWAQDAAAMYAYAGAAATASKVIPFDSPPVTIDPAGLARREGTMAKTTRSLAGAGAQEILATGSQVIRTVPPTLQRLASPSGFTWSLSWSTPSPSGLSSLPQPGSPFVPAAVAMYAPYPINSVLAAMGFGRSNDTPGIAAIRPVPSGTATGDSTAFAPKPDPAFSGTFSAPGAGDPGSGVSAGVGGASRVGRLSVPGTWFAVASICQPATTGVGLPVVLWRTSSGHGPVGVRITPIASTAGRRVSPAVASRLKVGRGVVPRPPAAG